MPYPESRRRPAPIGVGRRPSETATTSQRWWQLHSDTMHPLLPASRAVAPVLRAHADANEEARRLVPAVITALQEADFFRMCVPAVYGGPEVDPVTYLSVIEELAAADAASGWCANISSTTASMSWFLEEAWAREIFGTNRASGGAFAPTGKGTAVAGGWRVSGKWAWGSGTQHSAWITAGTMCDNGEFHLMFAPRGEVTDLDTWFSLGLRGTGSTDFALNDVFVPDGRSVQPLKGKAVPTCALAHFPNFGMLAAGVASTTLGIARRAIEELVTLATEKTPLFARSKLAEHPPAQLAVARAESLLSSARAFLTDEVAKAWETTQTGTRVEVAQRARIRLACAHAAEVTTEAVDLCHRSGGGTAVYTSSPLQRCVRDIHTASAHLMVSDRNTLTYAKLAFGLDADVSML